MIQNSILSEGFFAAQTRGGWLAGLKAGHGEIG
jgi:hypothetical protein